MAGSTPSSLSRYRPAILVLTGAAAAYTAWLLYTIVQAPAHAQPDLHRSNALRRAGRRARTRPRTEAAAQAEAEAEAQAHGILERLQHESVPLGEVAFFGHDIPLDARRVVAVEDLRAAAREYEPTASPEMVEDAIVRVYDTFYDRLLNHVFPERALLAAEMDMVARLIEEQVPQDPQAFERAMERHRNRFALADTQALLTADAAESIAATDQSWPSDEDTEGGIDPEGHTLQRTLYHIAEDRARHLGVIHRGITCNGCDTKPIRGIRWRCANCSDYDLCSDCEATNSHYKTHIFYKVRVPAPYMGLPKQEPIYPGRPHFMNPSVNTPLKKRLVEQTQMEAEEVEALWDQFTCLAATEWTSDPNQIGWALDRRAFNHAFIPRYSSFTSVPNLVYDRIFSYFDTDQNALIGFEEFIKGLDGLHSTDTSVKMRIAFNGYDADGDGYISRKDVLRIFRAHYAIEREATRNYLAESAEELSVRGALETIQSAQPLGSAFTQSMSPTGERGPPSPRPKCLNGHVPDPILDDVPDTLDRAIILTEGFPNEYNRATTDAEEALRTRWARRQYYVDEEEGLQPPSGVEVEPSPEELDGQTDGEVEEPETPDFGRRRGSRSSSRVRFQDDIDVETRSNASTSSRPIGERWGGYEIPEPEKDLGKEVLYQITQQAFNELLDPLFKEKERVAMDAIATRAERRLHATQIENLCKETFAERKLNKAFFVLGQQKYVNRAIAIFCRRNALQLFKRSDPVTRDDLVQEIKKCFGSAEQYFLDGEQPWMNDAYTPDEDCLWDAKLSRIQILLELTEAVVTLVGDRLQTSKDDIKTAKLTHRSVDTYLTTYPAARNGVYRDPTMPQFRPNSMTDPPSRSQSEATNTSHESPSFGPFFVMAGEATATPPQDNELAGHTFLHLYLHPTTLALSPIRAKHLEPDPFIYSEAMRTEALCNKDSSLRLPFLASLEGMDREISQRGGSGMVDFDEFVEIVETGRLRFLESWMDFVSF
ncbi:hypothetical protein P280DRAFT_246770 [Massarina eburnea CBS 473.64]|uniref:EF-hand n=1 Tax=Massarina eburnea CBS 473.64 TaxID=1395130 RepID=A0A6A6S6N1_9PLEO|nr:hypothetical protein P280DRAFT_246770 [Massarina eburnea CBS 473.64]